jgi:ferredoxin/flavodoxin---NADP+ reductase
MALQWIPGQIEAKHVWSDGLFTLRVHCPGVQPFEAGQFLQVGMTLPEKHLHRPYSVASPHADSLDFFIVRVDGGELTPRLWSMNVGDPIDVSAKATGGFTLSHSPKSETIWLMCTGTGLAPYIAMLRDRSIWSSYENVVLVHGVRFMSDLAYQSELGAVSEEYFGRFKFIPVVSRESGEGVLSGRITHLIENGQLEQHVDCALSPDSSVVMMCGNPQMLDDVEALLKARNMLRHKSSQPGHIIVERYW